MMRYAARMSDHTKRRFRMAVAEYGLSAVVLVMLSFCLCLFGTLEAADTAPELIGRDLAWFCVYWSSVFLLLASAGEAFRPFCPDVQQQSPREEIRHEFAGVLVFWATGCAAVAVASALGMYLGSGFIWSGFLMMIAGTIVCLLPLTALTILIRIRLTTAVCRCLLIVWLVLGHHLDQIRDRLDLWHSGWLNALFECAAILVPEQGLPNWRDWLVFQLAPPLSVLLTVVLSSLVLSWFFLALAGALRARDGVAGYPMHDAESRL